MRIGILNGGQRGGALFRIKANDEEDFLVFLQSRHHFVGQVVPGAANVLLALLRTGAFAFALVFLVVLSASYVHLIPGTGYPDETNFTSKTVTDEYEATFEPGNETSLFSSVHLNINSPLDEASIKAIAKREGWRCLTANRGGGLFQLIEVWIENRFMLEVNTPEMTQVYREIATPEKWAEFLQMPLPQKYSKNYAPAEAGVIG